MSIQKHSLKNALSSNYKSFNTWKIRQKTPTIMISRQNGDFLAVSLFSEAISLLLIALAV